MVDPDGPAARIAGSPASASTPSIAPGRADLRHRTGRPPRGRARPSAHATVARGLGLAILSGEIPVGSLLPAKDVLMARFGVSNTSLREAVQTLAAKGLVAARTKIGTWVVDQSHWAMFDPHILGWQLEVGVDKAFLARLFEMRQTLEPVAAAAAARRRSDEEADHLLALAGAMGNRGHDKASFTALDVSFHLRLLEATGNPFLRSIGAAISTALAASFARSAPTDDEGRIELAARQHHAIADAIRRREPQAAAEAMIAVIRQGWAYSGGQPPPLATLSVEDFPAAV